MNNVGPYLDVSGDKTRGDFRVVLYGARSVEGLISTSSNGIAILDERTRQVLLDQECCGKSYGPQVDRFHEILRMSEQELVEFVNNHPRARYSI